MSAVYTRLVNTITITSVSVSSISDSSSTRLLYPRNTRVQVGVGEYKSDRSCTVPFGRVEMSFHVFDLLEMKRHVRSENDVDDGTPELPEKYRSTTATLSLIRTLV